jgi:hypothetical protein
LMGALGWATGRVDADIEPNVRKVTPNYDQLHARGGTTRRPVTAPAK